MINEYGGEFKFFAHPSARPSEGNRGRHVEKDSPNECTRHSRLACSCSVQSSSAPCGRATWSHESASASDSGSKWTSMNITHPSYAPGEYPNTRSSRLCICLIFRGVRHLLLFRLADGLDGRRMSRLTRCSAALVAVYLTNYDSEPLVGRGELRGSTCQPIALLS